MPLRRTYNAETNKSSTWAVGNDLIGVCLKALGNKAGKIVKVTNWMGCSNSYINLKKDDSLDKIDEQFQSLKEEIE